MLGIGKDRKAALAVRDNDRLDELGIGDAIEGLAGLITMGAAWESIDAYYALALALQVDGKSAFSHFAALRVQELLEQGEQSIVANLPETAFEPENLAGIGYNLSRDTEAAEAEFESLRQQADAWHDKRTAYMLAAMGEGRHPDTHPDFWAGFDGDPERVEIPDQGAITAFWNSTRAWWREGGYTIAIPIGLATVFVVGLPFVLRSKRRRRIRQADNW